MNNKQALNSTDASRNYSEIQKEGRTIPGPIQGHVTFIQPRNGQITGSATIGPPPLPTASQICPNPGWTVKIVSLTYDNVVIHIQQNGQDILTFDFGNVDP